MKMGRLLKRNICNQYRIVLKEISCWYKFISSLGHLNGLLFANVIFWIGFFLYLYRANKNCKLRIITRRRIIRTRRKNGNRNLIDATSINSFTITKYKKIWWNDCKTLIYSRLILKVLNHDSKDKIYSML